MSQPEALASHWVLLFFLAILNKYILAWSTDITSVERSSSRQEYIHRSWAEWTLWSACSRTCGGGVKSRTRICRLRIAKSDAFSSTCIGENIEYELCSIQNCSPHDKEFFEYQCSLRNGQIFGGRKIEEWIPYRYGKNSCELQCWSKDRSLVRSFGKVIDGTKCAPADPKEPAICINGRCTTVDCAGQIGRDNKMDRCGVCRGNNSTCVHYQDIYWKRPRTRALPDGSKDHYDYDKITTIPAGATEIIVEENSERNFLALMDHTGNYHVNGNWRIQSPGLFLVHGSEFRYNRNWDGSESLSTLGPTRYDITIYVLGSGDIPTVYFEYWISSNNPYKPVSSAQTTTLIKNLDVYEIDKAFNRQNAMYSPENNHIHDDFLMKKRLNTQFQGYKSYYHRNEILNSVPSWSSKRHGVHKNNFNKTPQTPDDDSTSPKVVEIEVSSKLPVLADPKDIYEINKITPRDGESYNSKNDPTKPKSFSYTRTFFPDYSNKTFYQTEYIRGNSTLKSRKNFKVFDPTQLSSVNKIPAPHERKIAKLEQPLDSYRKRNSTVERAKTAPYRTITVQPNLIEEGQIKKDKRGHRSAKHLKKSNDVKEELGQKRRKSENDKCSCTKPKEQKKNFCESEFVLRAIILSTEKQEHSFRYEVQVVQSYKNKVPISNREYIWTTDLCRCPKLRTGKEYIIMGDSGASPNRRESRLLLSRNSFVRKYSKRRVRTMQRLVRDQYSVCKNLK